MKENFDCTQIITFDLYNEFDIHEKLYKFADIGLKIIPFKEMRDVKKKYFKDFLLKNTYELECVEFFGNFEDWLEIDEVPKEINDFIQLVKLFAADNNVKELRIIISEFAEENKTSNMVIGCNVGKLNETLFGMSSHNFDVWVNNLIIVLEK